VLRGGLPTRHSASLRARFRLRAADPASPAPGARATVDAPFGRPLPPTSLRRTRPRPRPRPRPRIDCERGCRRAAALRCPGLAAIPEL
jgi:hypothetical protein